MLIDCNKVPNKRVSHPRRKSSDFAFELYDSVEKINRDDWESVVCLGSEFLRLPFLTVLEKEAPENMRFHYAIVYRGKRPCCIAYFQLIDFSPESFGQLLEQDNQGFSCFITDYIKKHVTKHLKKNNHKINIRLLVCGNAFVSGEHGFTFSPEISASAAFDALADVIYKISLIEKLRGKIAAVLVKDFYKKSIIASDQLSEFNYHNFLVEPNMILDLEWKSFGDYLNSMSKKYRNRAKMIIRKGVELERRDFTAKDIIANSKRIMQLFNNVHLKARFRMASLSPGYFAEMKKVLSDRFVFTGYYHNDKLIGFRSAFILEKNVEAHFVGLDYKVNKDFELYQNILYDYVREAIDHGAEKLILGRTASEIKSSVGAEAHELTCYIRHRNPLSNRIIKPFVDYLKPSEWIPRNPFKEVSV